MEFKQSKEILLNLKNQLEGSIGNLKAETHRAGNLGYYQIAADFQQQLIGYKFALALINEELAGINLVAVK